MFNAQRSRNPLYGGTAKRRSAAGLSLDTPATSAAPQPAATADDDDFDADFLREVERVESQLPGAAPPTTAAVPPPATSAAAARPPHVAHCAQTAEDHQAAATATDQQLENGTVEIFKAKLKTAERDRDKVLAELVAVKDELRKTKQQHDAEVASAKEGLAAQIQFLMQEKKTLADDKANVERKLQQRINELQAMLAQHGQVDAQAPVSAAAVPPTPQAGLRANSAQHNVAVASKAPATPLGKRPTRTPSSSSRKPTTPGAGVVPDWVAFNNKGDATTPSATAAAMSPATAATFALPPKASDRHDEDGDERGLLWLKRWKSAEHELQALRGMFYRSSCFTTDSRQQEGGNATADSANLEVAFSMEQMAEIDGDRGLAMLHTLSRHLQDAAAQKTLDERCTVALERLCGLVMASATVRAALVFPEGTLLDSCHVSAAFRSPGALPLKSLPTKADARVRHPLSPFDADLSLERANADSSIAGPSEMVSIAGRYMSVVGALFQLLNLALKSAATSATTLSAPARLSAIILKRLAGTAPRTYEKPFDALLAGKSAAELTASLWTELGKHWHHNEILSLLYGFLGFPSMQQRLREPVGRPLLKAMVLRLAPAANAEDLRLARQVLHFLTTFVAAQENAGITLLGTFPELVSSGFKLVDAEMSRLRDRTIEDANLSFDTIKTTVGLLLVLPWNDAELSKFCATTACTHLGVRVLVDLMRLYKREEYFKSQRAAMEDAADLCTEFYRAAGEPMPADMDWQTQPAAAAAAGTDTV